MCGIVGLVAGDTAVDERALRRMTAALAARGPDGEGFHVEPRAALGHRRLAIIDLPGGRQPLLGVDGRTAAVVNGEIYNFVALRAELERAGRRFTTRSDAEVVVHGYDEWGDAVLGRLEGMFALAIWDGARGRMLLARDRMGEKPLYWAALPFGAFAFASELKALRHAPGFDPALDPGAVARYLVYEFVPAPATIVAAARKLEPGTSVVVEPGRAPVVRRWWDLPVAPPDRIDDGDAAAPELLAQLRRSVRERLIADVPLGVFLSGGLDSSAIAALAAEARGRELDTFSAGFDDPSFDESPSARLVAGHIGSRHHELRITSADALETAAGVGELLDEPLGDASIISTHLLARFARETVKVALGGDGADELFAGYPTFQADLFARVIDRLPGAGSALAATARTLARLSPASDRYLSTGMKLAQFARGMAAEGPRRHQLWMSSFTPPEAAALVGDVSADLLDVVDRRALDSAARDQGDLLLEHYARGYLADDVLPKLDRASMAAGLEVRAPFLDTAFVTFACRLSPSLRLRRGETKHILRRALRGLLPAATLRRRKHGFAVPVAGWIRGPLRGVFQETFTEGRTAPLDPLPLQALLAAHLSGGADHRKSLWTAFALLRWHDAWRRGAG